MNAPEYSEQKERHSMRSQTSVQNVRLLAKARNLTARKIYAHDKYILEDVTGAPVYRDGSPMILTLAEVEAYLRSVPTTGQIERGEV